MEDNGSVVVQPEEDETVARRKKEFKERLKDKIRAIGRMERILRNLREN